jgi:mRNA-degrading endonuclease toxin of MazEF toxin-antitoxin module
LASYTRGDIVWAKIEKTVSGGYKERPVLILASWPCNGTVDYMVCICSTSKISDPYKMSFSDADLESGSLKSDECGFIRPSYLTSIIEADITHLAGRLCSAKLEEVMKTLRTILA